MLMRQPAFFVGLRLSYRAEQLTAVSAAEATEQEIIELISLKIYFQT